MAHAHPSWGRHDEVREDARVVTHAGQEAEEIRIVCVCTGNLCRSAQAAQLLRSRAPSSAGSVLNIASAGTHAREGDRMPSVAAEWSRRLGGDPSEHRAQYLTARPLRGADLVLGMAREHRRAAVTLEPSLTRVAFTLRELARLAAPMSEERLAREAETAGPGASARTRLNVLLAFLARARGTAERRVEPADDDVVDPMGRDDVTYELSAGQVDVAVNQVVRVLGVALRVLQP